MHIKLVVGMKDYQKRVSAARDANEIADPLQILIDMKIGVNVDLASLALSAIWTPVSNADSERFFSKYALVVSDRRTRMKEETVQTCSMLYFN